MIAVRGLVLPSPTWINGPVHGCRIRDPYGIDNGSGYRERPHIPPQIAEEEPVHRAGRNRSVGNEW